MIFLGKVAGTIRIACERVNEIHDELPLGAGARRGYQNLVVDVNLVGLHELSPHRGGVQIRLE